VRGRVAMRRLLALSLLCSAPVFGLTAGDEAVKRPFVEKGDCWSFSAINLENHGPIGNYDECITFVDWDKDVILAVATLKSNGREIDTSYSTAWSFRTTIDGTINTGHQDQETLKFPLYVGETYSVKYEWRQAKLGPNQGDFVWNVVVVGWENITVPAGTFRALKIEGHGTAHRYDTELKVPVAFTWWYVPQVNRIVKYWFENPAGRRGIEMTGYRLNQ
jgi:hypothetical protein